MSLFIVFGEFAKALLPPDLKKTRVMELLQTLVSPLVHINMLLVGKRSAILYDLSFNGQVQYLERLINDKFDNDLRRCHIDDPALISQLPIYIYNKIEGQESQVVYNKSEGATDIVIFSHAENDGLPDFIVHMPADAYTSFNEPYLRSLINKYRIAGKRYAIQTF